VAQQKVSDPLPLVITQSEASHRSALPRMARQRGASG
jgi:hypothetical protein